MFKKLFICFACLLVFAPAFAGSGDSIPVIHVKEIRVFGNRFDFFTEGQQQLSISPVMLKYFGSNSLGDILTAAGSGSAYIKSYGAAGSLATISIRGASANQTQVNWNGFPLNSVTTGDADLSLVPVHFIDELTIHPGASASLYGSGTFGGSIDLINKFQHNKPFTAYFDSEFGSFHSRFLSTGIETSSAKISYSLSFLSRYSRNDFSFPDIYKPGVPVSLMAHNSLNYGGVFQNLSYSPNDRDKIDIGIWYQVKTKDIPRIMGSFGSSFASQKDSSLKLFARWTRSFNHSMLTIKSAYFTDYLHYLDKTSATEVGYSVNSKIFSRQFLSDLSYRNYFSSFFSSEAGLVTKTIFADVAAFSHNIVEPEFSFYSASKFTLKQLIVDFSARMEFTTNRQPNPVYSISANYKLFSDLLLLRLSSSSKYRLPTLNEKYWPGADPNILPEEGFTNEGGFILKCIQHSESSLSIESQLFSSRMKNLIQWTDSLVAVNYKAVWSRGGNILIHYQYQLPLFKFETSLGYEYIRSTNTKVYEGNEALLGKQLRYVPQNKLNLNTNLSYLNYSCAFMFNLVGKTYVNEDNTGMVLPFYSVSDFCLSLDKSIAGNDLKFSLRVNNLLNSHYQVIAAYPAPGRTFYIGLSFRFNSHKKTV